MTELNGNVHVKNNVGSDAQTILNEFLDGPNSDLYVPGSYIGKVVDNIDPEKLGRCKILVFGVFGADITPNELPWAIPEFGFIGSLRGSFIVPPIDAIVKIEFERDEINLPKYSTKVVNTKQLPTNKDKNYPNNMVFFETDNGDSFEIDRNTSETTFIHNTGTKITIDTDGNIEMYSNGETVVKHKGDYILEGGSVVEDPLLQGGLNCIHTCPYSGSIHVGQILAPRIPLGGARGD